MIDIFIELKNQLSKKLNERPVDHLISYYSNNPFNKRDIFCSNLIWDNFDKDVSKILIVGGNIPLVYLDKFKQYDLTFIDNNSCLSYCSDYIEEKYNCKIINENPITENLTSLIDANDLIIYPETETLIPFDLLRYTHKRKLVFCSNFLFYDFKINNNLAYSEDDLIDLCNIETIKLKGTEPLKFNDTVRNFYYVMGNAS